MHWIVESLFELPSYEEKAMFGCRACYLHGEMKLVLASQSDEPWNGLLIPTDRERHAALLAEIPELEVHPILGKWLYLPADQEDFEQLAEKLAVLASRNDPRFGIEPGEKRKARKKKGVAGRKREKQMRADQRSRKVR